jgi:hypothetical protein
VFVWLGLRAGRPQIHVDVTWGALLAAVTVVALVGSGAVLYRRTRFS